MLKNFRCQVKNVQGVQLFKILLGGTCPKKAWRHQNLKVNSLSIPSNLPRPCISRYREWSQSPAPETGINSHYVHISYPISCQSCWFYCFLSWLCPHLPFLLLPPSFSLLKAAKGFLKGYSASKLLFLHSICYPCQGYSTK